MTARKIFVFRPFARMLCCAVFVALLAACGSKGSAPVENRSLGTPRVDPATLAGAQFAGQPGYYTVQAGETIRSVSRTLNRDWKDIVRWNAQWVPNPDQLEVGQVLRVAPPEGDAPAAAAAASGTAADAAALNLIWPTASRDIITRFDGNVNKGIDIAGKASEPVYAAAAGRVLAAEPLARYGNLVVIQHNKSFVTVYAHNERLLVKVKQVVKQGEPIAEMGKTDTDRVKLHFEVRRGGKSVNPLSYLPAR